MTTVREFIQLLKGQKIVDVGFTKAGLDDDCAYANFEIHLENGYSFVA